LRVCLRQVSLFLFMWSTTHWGAVGHVTAPELPLENAEPGAHLGREARSGTEGHVAVPEPTSARRRGPEPWDTWQRRSPHWQGGEVQGCRTHGSAGAYLDREARSEANGHVAACGCTPCSLF
jgi:hypothetical protein